MPPPRPAELPRQQQYREHLHHRHVLLNLSPTAPHAVRAYWQAHTPTDFADAPLTAVRALLAYDALSIPEDAVLEAVLRYASRPPHNDALPDLLRHAVRLLSVSSRRVADDLEPLALLDSASLLSKFRFDALSKQLGPRAALRTCAHAEARYQQADAAAHVVMPTHAGVDVAAAAVTAAEHRLRGMMRGRAVVAESEHPYAPGDAELLERVCVGDCADAMLLEFDGRTHVAPGAQLTFYDDADASCVVARWADLWHRPDRKARARVLVLERGCVYVGLRVAFDAPPAWGWKLLALPISRSG